MGKTDNDFDNTMKRLAGLEQQMQEMIRQADERIKNASVNTPGKDKFLNEILTLFKTLHVNVYNPDGSFREAGRVFGEAFTAMLLCNIHMTLENAAERAEKGWKCDGKA